MPYSRIYNDPARLNTPQYALLIAQPISAAGSNPLVAIGRDLTSDHEPPACGLVPDFGPWGFTANKRYPKEKQVFLFARSWDGSFQWKRFYSYANLLSEPVGDSVFAAVTSAAVHLETDLPQGLAVIDLSTGDVKTAKAPRLSVETPRAVSGGSISRMVGPPWGLYFTSDGGINAQVLSTAAGRAVLQHVIDHARSDTVVWIEGTPEFKQTVLWESPLAKTMTEFKPRKIATMPEGWWGTVVANAGVVLVSVDGATARLVRVSDGQGWTIKSEPGLVFKSAVWANDDEVWFTTATPADAAEGPSGMLKLKRSALGVPDVPAGI